MSGVRKSDLAGRCRSRAAGAVLLLGLLLSGCELGSSSSPVAQRSANKPPAKSTSLPSNSTIAAAGRAVGTQKVGEGALIAPPPSTAPAQVIQRSARADTGSLTTLTATLARPTARPTPITILTVPPSYSPLPTPTPQWTFRVGAISFVDDLHGWTLGDACSWTYPSPDTSQLQTPGIQYQKTCGSTLRSTTDGGQTWQPVGSSLLQVAIPADENILFVTRQDGWAFPDLFVTHDGGRTWTRDARNGGIVAMAAAGTAYKNASVWAVARSCSSGPDACSLKLVSSRDKGYSWQPVTSQPPFGYFVQLVRVSDQDGWILEGTDKGISLVVTHNGWQTWQEIPTPCNTDGGARTAGVTKGQIWLLCLSQAWPGHQPKEIYISNDWGKSWTLVALGKERSGQAGQPEDVLLEGYANDLIVSSPKVAWLPLSRGDIMSTTDGGRTWVSGLMFAGENDRYSLGTDEVKGPIVFIDSLHGWFGLGNEILYTNDGGKTWSHVRLGLSGLERGDDSGPAGW